MKSGTLAMIERRDSRADAQLGPGDAAGVDDEQEAADDRRSAPLAPARPLGRHVAAARRPPVEERAGDQEADGEHQERGQRPVGDRDREIRRSPDDVDGSESCCKFHAFSVPRPTD